MEDGPREELGELSNIFVRNVVVELLAMLCPRSGPKVFQDANGDGRNGIPLVPMEEGFPQNLPDLLLGGKDLVL